MLDVYFEPQIKGSRPRDISVNIEVACKPTASFSFLLTKKKNKAKLKWVDYNLGKWKYAP